MAGTTLSTDEIAREANRLYWNDSDTVEGLVDRLGISRNMLYSTIRPLPAGVSCDSCGERMVFRNRSNRSSAVTSCLACGKEEAMDDSTLNEATRAEQEGAWDTTLTRWRSDLAEVEPQRIALIGGATILGILAGAVAARAIREM
ncbi:MAG TPA: hypothetical protein VFI91_12705 [Longimicrobiaceae bacterium]|nr:hypothetical protein [Longimicrobiaceae bacterium]